MGNATPLFDDDRDLCVTLHFQREGQFEKIAVGDASYAIHAAYWMRRLGYADPLSVDLDDREIMDGGFLDAEIGAYQDGVEALI